MDPFTVTIVGALAAGAKDVATSAIKDAYAGLKSVITVSARQVRPRLKCPASAMGRPLALL